MNLNFNTSVSFNLIPLISRWRIQHWNHLFNGLFFVMSIYRWWIWTWTLGWFFDRDRNSSFWYVSCWLVRWSESILHIYSFRNSILWNSSPFSLCSATPMTEIKQRTDQTITNRDPEAWCRDSRGQAGLQLGRRWGFDKTVIVICLWNRMMLLFSPRVEKFFFQLEDSNMLKR